jgi:hypothetical protein
MNKSAAGPLKTLIQFRVSKKMKDYLQEYAQSNGKNNANDAARHIIYQKLSGINEQVIQKALSTIIEKEELLDLKLNYFTAKFSAYLINYFASHKKPPPDQAKAIAADAEERYNQFDDNFTNKMFKQNPNASQAYFANLLEQIRKESTSD